MIRLNWTDLDGPSWKDWTDLDGPGGAGQSWTDLADLDGAELDGKKKKKKKDGACVLILATPRVRPS